MLQAASLRCDNKDAVGASSLRRLTRTQYNHVVRDLLGDTRAIATAFAPDENTDGFFVGAFVSPALASQYFDAAESLAQEADLSQILPCDLNQADEACAARFIDQFGRRAYRRPLRQPERERLLTLHRGSAGAGFENAIRLVIRATLSSPHFLYHVEPTPAESSDGDVVPMDSFAMASRISFMLWSSSPDDELLDAAASGELDTAEGVATHVRRMLDDERARDGVLDLVRQWFGVADLVALEKDSSVYPAFSQDIARTLLRSFDAFVEEVIWSGDGSLNTLLTGAFAWVNEDIAPWFGVDDVRGPELVRVELPPDRYAGLLTHPAVLAAAAKHDQSDPIRRGLFVREKILCQHLPTPPDDVDLTVSEVKPGASTRERFAAHTADAACAGCHQLIDPIGFAFEQFDGVGRWRDTDQGQPVDASGSLTNTQGSDVTVDGARELAEALAENPEVQQCAARQFFRFAMQRVEANDDGCSVAASFEKFADTGFNIRELVVAVSQSRAFLHRQVSK